VRQESQSIARRVLNAAENGSLTLLGHELRAAEPLIEEREERLELLGAIAQDMRRQLSEGPSVWGPHLRLLRHLASSN
jgi:hypothetical protein